MFCLIPPVTKRVRNGNSSREEGKWSPFCPLPVFLLFFSLFLKTKNKKKRKKCPWRSNRSISVNFPFKTKRQRGKKESAFFFSLHQSRRVLRTFPSGNAVHYLALPSAFLFILFHFRFIDFLLVFAGILFRADFLLNLKLKLRRIKFFFTFFFLIFLSGSQLFLDKHFHINEGRK